MFTVISGATLVATSLLTLVWAFSSGKSAASNAGRHLTSGIVGSTDLRRIALEQSAGERAVRPAVAALARHGRRLTPAGRLDNLERRLNAAGASTRWPLERVLAAKVALGLAGAVFGGLLVVSSPSLGMVLLLAVCSAFGFWLPDILLVNAAQKRQEAVRANLADVFDQLTVMVEAGLGFDAALLRAAHGAKGALGEELIRCLQDMQAGMSRREALRLLSDRVDVSELRGFVGAVMQADRYGVPIAQVLRVQAAEMRLKRSQRAEEKAMKLPVKLLFPTLIFIFPVLFIVLLGPAALHISRTLLT